VGPGQFHGNGAPNSAAAAGDDAGWFGQNRPISV
jgi:hypothetical protein